MLRKELYFRSNLFQQFLRFYSSSNAPINLEKLESESASAVDVFDEEAKLREELIQKRRNKSRLRESDRNFLHDKNPYPEETYWYHGTLKYKRRLYGRYGADSGIDPSICWPTKKELQDSIEYEQVANPYTIPELISMAHEKKRAEKEAIHVKQQDMLVKYSKLEEWKADMYRRIAKKEAEALAAREKRERLIEEVRRHFGYKVDPKDEKFKELLEKKEKEQRKLAKEARKKEKEAKLQEKLKKQKEEDRKRRKAKSKDSIDVQDDDDDDDLDDDKEKEILEKEK